MPSGVKLARLFHTAAFRVSQAATVQVFAPSGEEVFKSSESASVKWAGIHTWEDGTYYLAVHDVTGSQPNMTLEYMHMDKYDVVDWDVHTVGNGGCSTITFKGNGFRDLYAVVLYTAEGDTIHSVDVSHDSDAETAVTFDFTGAELSVYDAVFHFTEEDKLVSGVVTVEEAVDIELATNVTFPSTFLRGASTTYTVKITNKGNMTAYNIPVYLHISSPTFDGLSRMQLNDDNGDFISTSIYSDIISQGLADTLNIIEKQIGDLAYLAYFKDIGEKNDSLIIRNGYYWLTLKPYQATTLNVNLFSTEQLHMLFAIPDVWKSTKASYAFPQLHKSVIRQTEILDYIQCIINDMYNFLDCFNIYNIKHFILGDDPGSYRYAGFKGAPKHTKTNIWTSEKERCISSLKGGISNAIIPVDPNDIYGYLSEAGSRFIADSVAKVNYTIEFENDTAFATAAAHTIVIKDTLDGRYFDLDSFLPTSIKLGEREVFLDEADVKTEGGVTTFLTTIDVRPEINAIAQVEGTYSQQTGIAEWRFTSLDPMTMEPTDDLMQGILPVNYDGTSGIGEVMFEVGVKPNKGDGTEIANRAGIVFDYEEAILTPTWVNTVDAVAPVSTILGAIQSTDSTLTLRLAGEDNRSGVWKYNVYVQMGKGAMWVPVAENLTDSLCEVRIYEDIEYGFCVVATDSAGNVERKALAREFELTTCLPGDANGDGKVSITDAVYVVNYILGQPAIDFNVVAADVNGDGKVSITDAVMIVNIILGQGKTAQANALPEP